MSRSITDDLRLAANWLARDERDEAWLVRTLRQWLETPERPLSEFLARPPAGDFPETPSPEDSLATWGGGAAEGPAASGERTHQVPSLLTGERFRIVRPLARGGLGEVSVAEDQELGRLVALKEIRPQLAEDAECRQRFVREAEITGKLEHPGVVPVHGRGTHADGRPYYAMRLIGGQSLQHAIESLHAKGPPDSRALRRLLSRFVSVCRTLDFAHSRGVIHRDIKPANIMLGEYGETLVVDWGLARPVGPVEPSATSGGAETTDTSGAAAHLSHDVTRQTWKGAQGVGSSHTRQGELVGTPGFMSPEQLRGRHDELTAAADVYSLGATLYALLVGRPPRPAPEGDWQSPRAVVRGTPITLDLICRKSLADSPDDRYAGAGALADDVEAYLADEPVTAGREPWPIRLGRWTRRHRTAAASLATTAAVLLVSLSIGTALLTRSYQRERAERIEREQQRDRADENFQLARDAVNRYLVEVTNDPSLQSLGLEALRTRLLGIAEPFYERLAARRGQQGDERLLYDRAEAYVHLAEIRTADRLPAAAAALERALGALDERERVLPDDPFTLDQRVVALTQLAGVLRQLGNDREATRRADEAVRAAESLATKVADQPARRRLAAALIERSQLTQSLGQTRSSLRDSRRAVDLLRPPVTDDPQVERDRRRALSLALVRLAAALLADDQIEASRGAVDEAVALISKPSAPGTSTPASSGDPFDDRFLEQELAAALLTMAAGAMSANAFDEAQRLYDRVIEMRERLAGAYPQVIEYGRRLAAAYDGRAVLAARRGNLDEAERSFAKVRDEWRRLAAIDPNNVELQARLAASHNNVALAAFQLGDFATARDDFRQASAVWDRLVGRDSLSVEYRRRRASARINLGDSLRELGEHDEPDRLYRQAIDELQSLAAEHPESREVLAELAEAWQSRGILARRAADDDGARDAYRASIALYDRLCDEAPEQTLYLTQRGDVQLNLALLELLAGRHDEARRLYDALISGIVERLGPRPSAGNARFVLYRGLSQRALLGFRTAKWRESVDDCDAALALEGGGNDRELRLYRALALARLGEPAGLRTGLDRGGFAQLAEGDAELLGDLSLACAAARATVLADERRPTAERAADAELWGADCLRMLTAARAAGAATELLDDSLFNALRDREGFPK